MCGCFGLKSMHPVKHPARKQVVAVLVASSTIVASVPANVRVGVGVKTGLHATLVDIRVEPDIAPNGEHRTKYACPKSITLGPTESVE